MSLRDIPRHLASTVLVQASLGAGRFLGASAEDAHPFLRGAASRSPIAADCLARLQDLAHGIPESDSSIPCPPGLPFVGNLVDFFADPIGLIEKGYLEHGPIFSLRFGPQRVVVLLGPEHHRFFFHETDKKLSFEVYRSLRQMFADDV